MIVLCFIVFVMCLMSVGNLFDACVVCGVVCVLFVVVCVV